MNATSEECFNRATEAEHKAAIAKSETFVTAI